MGNHHGGLAPCWRVALTDFEQLICRRLADTRRKAGWTQEQLADKIGIETATLSRYETARIPVPLRVLGRAAAAFGIAPSVLLGKGRVALPRASSSERALL